MTDLTCQLDLCATNIEANNEILSKKGGKAAVAELDWTKPLSESIRKAQPFDVILCSDVLWHVVVDITEAEFLKTLDNLCGQHTVMLHTYEPRLEFNIITENGENLVWDRSKMLFPIHIASTSFAKMRQNSERSDDLNECPCSWIRADLSAIMLALRCLQRQGVIDLLYFSELTKSFNKNKY